MRHTIEIRLFELADRQDYIRQLVQIEDEILWAQKPIEVELPEMIKSPLITYKTPIHLKVLALAP